MNTLLSWLTAKSWKTTSAGLLAIVGGIVRLVFACKSGAITEEAVMTTFTTLITGVGLLLARDNDKSSEDIGVTPEDKAGLVKPLPKMPPLTLWLMLGLLSAGLLAGCVTGKRLEAGGAYSQTATSAALPELFVLDSSFDVAYDALDTTFKFERANRTMLWAISPNIKHSLDKLRVEASQVKLDYAIARQAYLANSIQTNLDALTTALTKLQAVNIAALTVIQNKGL